MARGGRVVRLAGAWRLLFLATFALALVAPSRAIAQGCCTPGAGPLTGLRAGGLSAFTVRGGLAWDRYDLRTTLKGSEETEPLAERKARYSRLTLQLEAGLPAGMRFGVEAPWEFRNREVVLPIGGEEPARLDFDNSAFGDLTTTLVVEVAPRAATPRPWSIEVGGGVKWATGSIDAEDDGFALPPELQSGTGSVDPLAVAAARWYAADWGVVGTFLYRATGTNDIGYRFGREADIGLAAWWVIVPAVSAGADIRWRSAGHDEFLDVTRPNSGGTRWLAGPRLAARLPYPGPSFEVAGLFPVHQELNGTQLGVDVQWTMAISWQGR
ncbi:MAG TPA: hypothetical protein VF720_06190 [Candidatus Eisenbacteria bacterium]